MTFLQEIVRSALSRGTPFALLILASYLMTINDPRPTDMSDRLERADWAPTARRRSLAALASNSTSEASALLAVLAEFHSGNEELASLARSEIAARPPLRPTWLSRIGQTRIHRAVLVSDPLDRVDHLLLQGRAPVRRGDFTCAVCLDLEGLERVLEAGVVEGTAEDAIAMFDRPTSDIRCSDVALADARARVERVIQYESWLPPAESESWPLHRALVEWLVRTLPEGGWPLARPDLDDVDGEALANRFLASSHGSLFGPRHRQLIDSIIEYGSVYGVGDPMRWNVFRAERWLRDSVVEDEDLVFLESPQSAPLLLRAFIRFAHEEVGIRTALTDDVIGAVESLEREFQDRLRRRLADCDEDDGYEDHDGYDGYADHDDDECEDDHRGDDAVEAG